MAKYDLTLQFYGAGGVESITFKTRSADVDGEDVKDILNSFLENQDVQPLLRNGPPFIVAEAVKTVRPSH